MAAQISPPSSYTSPSGRELRNNAVGALSHEPMSTAV